MSDKLSQIVGPWRTAVDGSRDGGNVPQIALDYPLLMFTDVTAQDPMPPGINLLTVEAMVNDDTFASIMADQKYHVLWDTPNPRTPDEMPGAAEWGLLRSYLARSGMKQAQITAAIGTQINGRNRREIAEQLTAWLRTA